MPGLPVARNNNLDRDNAQLPIASNTPVGALGGIKADGSTITVNQTTGVASASGSGGGNLSGTLTTGKLPVATAAHTLGDSHIDDGLTTADTLTASEPLSVQAHAAIGEGSSIDKEGPVTLTVFEEVTTDGPAGMVCDIEWTPTGAVQTTGFGAAFSIEGYLDGNSAADSIVGFQSTANNYSDTQEVTGVTGGIIQVTNNGAGNVDHAFGIEATVANIGAGHIVQADVFHVDQITNQDGGTIGQTCGVNIDDQTVGVTNFAIITGKGLVSFGDSVILQPMTSDPSSLTNGEIWYNGTEQSLNARINGATVPLGPDGAFSITQKLIAPGVFNFTGIPQTKNTLVLDFIGNSNGGFTAPWLQLNGDVGADYTYYYTQEGAASASSGVVQNADAIFAGSVCGVTTVPNTTVIRIIIPGYTDASLHKNVILQATMPNDGFGSFYYFKGGGIWLPATDAPITSLLFQMNPTVITSGFFAAGSICTISGQ